LCRDLQLAAGEDEYPRFCLSRPDDVYLNRGACPATQPVVNHIPEIAPPRWLAVDVGDDVSNPYSGQMSRPAGNELFDSYPAVGPGDAVNPHPTKIPGCVGSRKNGGRYQQGNKC